jgi:hypothetical protein
MNCSIQSGSSQFLKDKNHYNQSVRESKSVVRGGASWTPVSCSCPIERYKATEELQDAELLFSWDFAFRVCPQFFFLRVELIYHTIHQIR